MPEHKLAVAGADGPAEGFLYMPEESGASAKAWPGVLYFTDVWGIRAANQAMAQRVAAQGYAVLMPNIFYRTDLLPIMPPGEPDTSDPATLRRLSHLLAALNAQQMRRDGAAYAQFLLALPQVEGSKIGVVGYCFSGQFALRTAASVPEMVAAAASFHGGHLVTEGQDSPHTELPKVTAELYFGHAVEDQSMPPAAIAKLDDALKGWGGAYQSEIYEGARHGWSVPGRPVYNPAQSERHFAKLFDLLARNLK
ncbi:MAG: dienelactone hydrolase family protein [Alphaproteobacteria bacterium]|nr:dienelactone hydrolase family protein [Alphaproteobacteria bacterium]